MVERSAQSIGCDTSQRKALAQLFQEAAVGQLEDKLKMALSTKSSKHSGLMLGPDPASIKHVVCSGGVASNAFLRERVTRCLDQIGRSDVTVLFPP